MAIVVSVWIVLGIGSCLTSLPTLDYTDAEAWLAGASTIAVLGLVDDVHPLPASVRLFIQVAVATLVLAVVLRTNELAFVRGVRMHLPREVMLAPAVLFVVGVTNIYNFMDGIAATQTVSAALALGAVAAAAGQLDIALIAFVTAAAAGGFFLHNAPPATLFLGDAGSTFLGFTFSSLAFVAATRPSPLPIGVVPAALAPFLLDGTFTILRRLVRGERIWRAHRTHLYQRAVATGLSHRDVLFAYAAWSALAAGGAALVSQCASSWTLVTELAMVLPLGIVWGWVVRREARTERSSA